MARFNYKQIIYAGMVCIAAVDSRVTKFEKKHINDVFDRYMKLSSKEKNEVVSVWESNQDAFSEIIVEELKAFSKRDQIEAFTYIMKYISWSKTKYNTSTKPTVKGVDPERAEINMYYDKALEILKELDFTEEEYALATRTNSRK
jgi:hypothetical protein